MAGRAGMGLHRKRSGTLDLAAAGQLAPAPREEDRPGALRTLAAGLITRGLGVLSYRTPPAPWLKLHLHFLKEQFNHGRTPLPAANGSLERFFYPRQRPARLPA
ncbi:hypothetical protein METHP14_640024 [Pseudomonas sp. P14-2025]